MDARPQLARQKRPAGGCRRGLPGALVHHCTDTTGCSSVTPAVVCSAPRQQLHVQKCRVPSSTIGAARRAVQPAGRGRRRGLWAPSPSSATPHCSNLQYIIFRQLPISILVCRLQALPEGGGSINPAIGSCTDCMASRSECPWCCGRNHDARRTVRRQDLFAARHVAATSHGTPACPSVLRTTLGGYTQRYCSASRGQRHALASGSTLKMGPKTGGGKVHAGGEVGRTRGKTMQQCWSQQQLCRWKIRRQGWSAGVRASRCKTIQQVSGLGSGPGQ